MDGKRRGTNSKGQVGIAELGENAAKIRALKLSIV